MITSTRKMTVKILFVFTIKSKKLIYLLPIADSADFEIPSLSKATTIKLMMTNKIMQYLNNAWVAILKRNLVRPFL
jgi:hypothetical protein